jgi:hypothetical protein
VPAAESGADVDDGHSAQPSSALTIAGGESAACRRNKQAGLTRRYAARSRVGRHAVVGDGAVGTLAVVRGSSRQISVSADSQVSCAASARRLSSAALACTRERRSAPLGREMTAAVPECMVAAAQSGPQAGASISRGTNSVAPVPNREVLGTIPTFPQVFTQQPPWKAGVVLTLRRGLTRLGRHAGDRGAPCLRVARSGSPARQARPSAIPPIRPDVDNLKRRLESGRTESSRA